MNVETTRVPAPDGTRTDGRATLNADDAALLRLLASGPLGISGLAAALGSGEKHAHNVLAGRRPVDREGFERALRFLGSPLLSTRPSSLSSSPDTWYERMRLPALAAPRQSAAPPRSVHVGFDRLLLRWDAEPSALAAIVPSFGAPLDIAISDQRSGALRLKRLAVDELHQYRVRVGVFDANEVLLATLYAYPRRRSLRDARCELTGALWRREGLALAVVRRLFSPSFILSSVEVGALDVAIDMDVDPNVLLLFARDQSRFTMTRADSFWFEHDGDTPNLTYGRHNATVTMYDKFVEELSRSHREFMGVFEKSRRKRASAVRIAIARRSLRLPEHLVGWQHATRIETRVAPKSVGHEPTIEGSLDAVREILTGMRIADLRLVERFDETAYLLSEARLCGVVPAPPTMHALKRAVLRGEKLKDDRRAMHLGADLLRRLTRVGRDEQIAVDCARLLHARTVAELHRLADRTPLALTEIFDEHRAHLAAQLCALVQP